MKLNLVYNNKPDLITGSGWLNIETAPNADNYNNKTAKINVLNLDEYIDNDECEEIYTYGVLSNFPIEDVRTIVVNLCRKLRAKGKICFSDVDADIIFRLHIHRAMDLNGINKALFGDGKKSILSIGFVENLLKAGGVTVTAKFFDATGFTIVGIKDDL